MNLSQLYYFKKLAELQHYTNAAKELYITQPSLSDSIASLEEELETKLFVKEGRNIKLTKIGREFYQYVCASLNELDTGIAMVKEQAGGIGGTINIGCIPTLLSDFLPDAIQGYTTSKNPKAKINIFQGHSQPIIAGLKSGEYDIGFCSKYDNEPDIVFIPITYQPFVVIVKTGHALSNRDTLHLEDLKPYTVLTYRESIPIGKNILPYLRENKLNPAAQFDDELSIGGIVSSNNVVGIVAETPYLRQFSNLMRIPLTGIPNDAHLVYMAYKKKTYISKATESFADYVVATKLNLP